jgi:hypothetical protein
LFAGEFGCNCGGLIVIRLRRGDDQAGDMASRCDLPGMRAVDAGALGTIRDILLSSARSTIWDCQVGVRVTTGSLLIRLRVTR